MSCTDIRQLFRKFFGGPSGHVLDEGGAAFDLMATHARWLWEDFRVGGSYGYTNFLLDVLAS